MIKTTKNSGYTIRKTELYHAENIRRYYIVLAENELSGFWCTWDCIQYQDGNENFFWGHYFTKKEDALHDYYTRLANAFCNPW